MHFNIYNLCFQLIFLLIVILIHDNPAKPYVFAINSQTLESTERKYSIVENFQTGKKAIEADTSSSIDWDNLIQDAASKINDWYANMDNLQRNQSLIEQGRVQVNQTSTTNNETATSPEDDLDPNTFRNIFSGRSEATDELAKNAYIALEIAKRIATQNNLTDRTSGQQLGRFSPPASFIEEYCPYNDYPGRSVSAPNPTINSNGKTERQTDVTVEGQQGRNYLDDGTIHLAFRTADGSFNNPYDPLMGRSGTPYLNTLYPHFSDGIQAFRFGSDGTFLPNARRLSLLIHQLPNNADTPTKIKEFPNLSLFFTQWGQFMVHDMVLTPLSQVPRSKCCAPFNHDNPNCATIPLLLDDPFYTYFGKDCLEFTRSSPSFRRDCTLGPKVTLNSQTGWLDLSTVYGTNGNDQRNLRSYRYGTLHIRDKAYFHDILDFLPLHPNGTQKGCVDELCYLAGDPRVNENPGLTVIHLIFLREHNRIALGLAALNPHWDDERLFQEARRIVIAEYQHVVYAHFLPIVLGKRIISLYPDLQILSYYYQPGNPYWPYYDANIDATVSQIFATSAFRYGHSMVADKMIFTNTKETIVKDFREGYFRPHLISGQEFPELPDNVIQGMLFQKSYIMDNWISPEVADHLYETRPEIPGLDLMALDIQRGRDHGLPAYNEWRKYCGLKPFLTFDELADIFPIDLIDKYRSIYALLSVDDIDVVSAGYSEYWIYDSILGPTFTCIIVEQMIRTRKGDRFWYENSPSKYTNAFTPEQLAMIKTTSLARIICQNAQYLGHIQPNVFYAPSESNGAVLCESLPDLNLLAWKEQYY